MELLPVAEYARFNEQAHSYYVRGEIAEASKLFQWVAEQIEAVSKEEQGQTNKWSLGIGTALGWLLGGPLGAAGGAAVGYMMNKNRAKEVMVHSEYRDVYLDAVEGLLRCARAQH